MFWPARSKDFEKLILSVLSTYFYLKGIDVSCPVNFQHKKSILYFLYKAILGPLKSCFDQLDQEFLKNWSYLSYPRIFISREMLFREKTMFKMYFLYKPILTLLKSCFDKLDQEFSRCWSILAKNQIISLTKCTCMIGLIFMLNYCLTS